MSGLEFVGAVASVAQITHYILRVISSFNELCTKMQDASARIQQNTTTIMEFNDIAGLIQSNQRLQNPVVISILERVLERAEAARRLLSVFTNVGITSPKWVKKHWHAYNSVRKEKQILAILANLEEKKTALMLCISAIQAKDAEDFIPKVNFLHQEFSTLRKQLTTHYSVSDGIITDIHTPELPVESHPKIPAHSRLCTAAKTHLTCVNTPDQSLKTPLGENIPGSPPVPCSKSGNSYRDVEARGRSRQVNGNVSSADALFERHSFTRVLASESSFQINGNILDSARFALAIFESDR